MKLRTFNFDALIYDYEKEALRKALRLSFKGKKTFRYMAYMFQHFIKIELNL